MTHTVWLGRPHPGSQRASDHRSGFTLVELLTVLFIISLLIGILIPSLSSARNAAKKASTKAVFASLETGLESFKNENEREFRATNGYPPSFSHPPIRGTFDPYVGEFPFEPSKPIVTGAHWLPAMLLGTDTLGFIARRSVPDALKAEPWEWYKSDNGKPLLDRGSLYLDPGGLRMIATKDLPGDPNPALFTTWNTLSTPGDLSVRDLPVIVDSFEQPILYYAANTFGTTRNMLEDEHDRTNTYNEKGPPYYFHQDNAAFTGTVDEVGWLFGDKPHAVADPGDLATAGTIETYSGATPATPGKTFARFIHDRKARLAQIKSLGFDNMDAAPLKPSNPDSYLLISAGVDGRFGTNDDVTNFPINEPG